MENANGDEIRPAASGFLKQTPAVAVSVLVHVIAILALALIVTLPPEKEKIRVMTSSASESDEDFEERPVEIMEQNAVTDADAAVVVDVDVVADVPVVASVDDIAAESLAVELAELGPQAALAADLMATIGGIGGTGGGFGRRSGAQRVKLARTGGGSPHSEKAVEAALKWLAEHQLPDGSWKLDLGKCPSCNGQCKNSGISDREVSVNGVTALVLLPFLGAGYTHQEGPYKQQVEAGIAILVRSVTENRAGEGYGLGITAIALSEAFAMTGDGSLRQPGQTAIDIVQASQDPSSGGWGYSSKSPGITSVTGFMVTACKSAHLAGLAVDPLVVKNANRFLDSMEYTHGGGVQYRYNSDFLNGEFKGSRNDADGESARALTCAATLCRMFMGYRKDHPAIQQTVERIVQFGPSVRKPYYNFYATQVVHHFGGEAWQRWNPAMRDLLVSTQSTQGHEAGSWLFEEDQQAGRVFCTAMSTMILEVYYRTMPIYGNQIVEKDFRE